MKANKNIIKGNKIAESKAVRDHKFYAIIEVKVKNADGTQSSKRLVANYEGTRIEAKNELNKVAKASGGKVTYFGGFKS